MRTGIRNWFMSLCLTPIVAYASGPEGYWKTIDDVTHKPKSIMHIWETATHTLEGKIVKIYPDPGRSEHEICTACTGENRNKPFLGLKILSGFQFNGQQWDNGHILDPRSGKVYQCNLKMLNPQRLLVHGYVGIPLFGRTQTWERAEKV